MRRMDAQAWIASYARELGTEPPTPAEFDAILDLAAVAAHSSQRMAAPVACWLGAHAGRSPDESLAVARRLAGEETR